MRMAPHIQGRNLPRPITTKPSTCYYSCPYQFCHLYNYTCSVRVCVLPPSFYVHTLHSQPATGPYVKLVDIGLSLITPGSDREGGRGWLRVGGVKTSPPPPPLTAAQCVVCSYIVLQQLLLLLLLLCQNRNKQLFFHAARQRVL